MSEHRTVLRSTSTISTITFISRVFGYIRDSRIAYLLGTGDLADAYSIAYRIPNLIRRIVGEGAVGAAFIPVFSEYLSAGKRKEAWEFANLMLAAAMVFLTVITILGILLSPWIVPVLAYGFQVTPGKLEITTVLNRIMFAYIALISISALASGILQSFNRFAAPSIGPVLVNLSIIAFSFLSGFFSNPAIAMAVGVIVGGVLQLAIQIPGLIGCGWRFHWIWDLAHPGVRRVTTLLAPRMFAIGIVHIDVLIGTQFAASMIAGSAASITFADRVMELVLGGYVIALSTAILPLLSRQSVERRIDELKTTLNFAIRIVLFVTLPASVGLVLLRKPIIQVLFERGEFTSTSTDLTAWALLFFAMGLSGFAMVKIIVQAFYALHETRAPVIVGLISLILNISLNFLFFHPLRNGGPALATSLSAVFDVVALTTLFRWKFGAIGMREVTRSGWKFGAAAAVMGVTAWWMIHLPGFYSGSLTRRAGSLLATIVASSVTYFGAAFLMRVREIKEVWSIYYP
jgi:putative peptidoglycan lipid II flippase